MRLIYSTDIRGGCPRPFRRGKKGTFCIRQRIGGKDIWRSLHTCDRKEAEYLAASIWREQQNGTVRSIIPIPPALIGMLWDEYRCSEKYQLMAESTRYKRSCTWRNFVDFCERKGIRYSNEINRPFVEEWLSMAKERKNHTYNNMLSEISSIFQQVRPDDNPCAGIQKKSIKRGAKASESYIALTRDQIAAIYLATRRWNTQNRQEWVDAITVALNTGARYKDIALMTYSSIKSDLRGKYLAFAPHKTENATGGKVVFIRMTRRLDNLLLRRKKTFGGPYIFSSLAADYNKGPGKRTTTNKFNENLRKRGVVGSFHCFRATVITAASRAGIDLKDFGGVVGHTTEKQTQAYNRAALDIDISSVISAI